MSHPPVCDYEGSDYQTSFWDAGGREYEDRCEAVALKRLLPRGGRLLLELGAGAGRNTPRYAGFERIVLLDYSRTQLEQARERLGTSPRYVYVAADAYRLPFVDGLFDAATMIRTLHHMADAPQALQQVREVMASGGVFILEFANKLNLKSILRYWLGKQKWSPFTHEPVEFVVLNYDFHPAAVRSWLEALGFHIQSILAVSHFRVRWLKRLVPTALLVWLDSLLQWSGAFWQLTPSVFLRASVESQGRTAPPAEGFFKCLNCGGHQLQETSNRVECTDCGSLWAVEGGIYDFRSPVM